MEKLAHSKLLNLILIFFGVGLLMLVSLELMHPLRSKLEPASGESSLLKENWFPKRTFDLITSAQAPVEGIDVNLIAELNPFNHSVPVAEPVKAEPPAGEPEPGPPPDTREISVAYRGLYRSSGGNPFVYVEIEGNMRVVSIDGMLAAPWKIDEADASQLILRKDEGTRVQIPFNRKKNLEVPID